MRLTGWFGLLFLVALICSILYCFDYAEELSLIEEKSKYQKFISKVLLFPMVIFGLIALSIGLSIVVWVLYNTFIERQPQYTGGFLTFGIAPALVIFGLILLNSMFKK
jgi:succinate dehydrogenase/fumarate reductase cytochrome b subunit